MADVNFKEVSRYTGNIPMNLGDANFTAVVVAVFGGSESRKTGVIKALSLVTFPPFNGVKTDSNPVRGANPLISGRTA